MQPAWRLSQTNILVGEKSTAILVRNKPICWVVLLSVFPPHRQQQPSSCRPKVGIVYTKADAISLHRCKSEAKVTEKVIIIRFNFVFRR